MHFEANSIINLKVCRMKHVLRIPWNILRNLDEAAILAIVDFVVFVFFLFGRLALIRASHSITLN